MNFTNMTKGQRISKQFIIATVFFLIVSGIGYSGYRLVKPLQVSPTPNPTANLAPIEVVFTKLIKVENNDYDFVAKLYNSNTEYGSSDVEYELSFMNERNDEVFKKTAHFFILPGQTKYIVDSPLKFSEPVKRAIVVIKKIDWQKLDALSANGVSLEIRNFSYVPVNQPGAFSKVGGSIANNSNFDLNRVKIIVLALDQNSEIIAVNRTEILTFLAETTRGFEVTWYKSFAGEVSRVEVEADTDVFENSNFLQRYERQERFQQFY